MNFIAKKLHWVGILLLIGFTATAAVLYFDTPGKAPEPKPVISADAKYVCPMHPDVVRTKPGTCPKCEMDLVPASELAKAKTEHAGCGMMEGAESSGCCGAKTTTAELTLPPGHPPIAGYTVQSGCDHSNGATTNATK